MLRQTGGLMAGLLYYFQGQLPGIWLAVEVYKERKRGRRSAATVRIAAEKADALSGIVWEVLGPRTKRRDMLKLNDVKQQLVQKGIKVKILEFYPNYP